MLAGSSSRRSELDLISSLTSPVADVAPAVELTVVAPAFNEAQNIAPLVSRVRGTLEGVEWQLIIVDDNSPDGTADSAKALAASDARVVCLRRIGRRGLAGAVIEGALASAAPDVAVLIDADLQHDETLLRAMLDTLRADPAGSGDRQSLYRVGHRGRGLLWSARRRKPPGDLAGRTCAQGASE